MIRLEKVTKSFENHTVLSDLTLCIDRGEHLAIMGKSGCGKTTLLRIIAGLEKPDSGSLASCDPGDIAVVFQESRLFESFTVLDNVAAIIDLPIREARDKAKRYLEAVGLSDALTLYPRELSGGMAQRVAIARAMAVERSILLLDEPFSALDEATGDNMIALIKAYCRDRTLILVTHNKKDAELLTDRTVFLPSENG